jgi:hypothetical protein
LTPFLASFRQKWAVINAHAPFFVDENCDTGVNALMREGLASAGARDDINGLVLMLLLCGDAG